MWSWSYKTKINPLTNVISQCSSKHVMTIYESSFLATSFCTLKQYKPLFLPASPRLRQLQQWSLWVPKGLRGPLKRKTPFVTGDIEEEKEGGGLERTGGGARDLTWGEKHVRECKPMSVCMHISASASVQVWACSFIHLNNCLSAWVGAWVAQLFEEDTNWQWDLWFKRREAVCLLFTVSEKENKSWKSCPIYPLVTI